MFDAIADLIEILLPDGVSSPGTLRAQRLARLAGGVVALVVNVALFLLLGASAIRGWSVLLLLGMTLVAGWVLVFSVVDAAKELPSLAWLSIAAAFVAFGCVAMTGVWALGIMPAGG